MREAAIAFHDFALWQLEGRMAEPRSAGPHAHVAGGRADAEENVVGWFQGRMEFDPRALGARSILGDARSRKMQSVMNRKIKYRESFRPFAPAVLREDVGQYFDIKTDSPYMLMVAPVNEDRRRAMSKAEEALFGIDSVVTVDQDLSLTEVLRQQWGEPLELFPYLMILLLLLLALENLLANKFYRREAETVS